MMMSDATATEAEEAPAAPTGELTELARLEIRIGKIVEVKTKRDDGHIHHIILFPKVRQLSTA